MYVSSSLIAIIVWINPVRLPIHARSWSAEQEKIMFPCLHSRLRIWTRETGSAAPFRVIMLILHTQAETGAYSQDSTRFPRRRPFIHNANRHWIYIHTLPFFAVSGSHITCPLHFISMVGVEKERHILI